MLLAHLSPPQASNISDAGRSGVILVPRGEACPQLDASAQVPADTLYPVIKYHPDVLRLQ